MKADLEVLLHFLKQYNGVTVVKDNVWPSNLKLELFADSAGSLNAVAEVQKPSSRSRPVANQNSNTDLEHLSQVADNIVNQGLENVVSGNGGVYRWVTLGPPPPHLIEGRPTPANRWAQITGALVIQVFSPVTPHATNMSDSLYTKAHTLEKNLNEWIKCKDEAVKELKELAVNLDDHFQKICKVKIAGSTTSLGGGILAVVGFGLSFVTFGASLGLTITGSVIAGAGGITVGGSMITDAVLSKQRRESAKAILDKYNDLVEIIKEECIEIGEMLKEKDEKMEQFPDWVDFWSKLTFGACTTTKSVTWDILAKTILASLRITASYADDALAVGARAGASAFRTIGSTAGQGLHIAGGVVGILVMPLDIYTLVDSAIDIHKNNPHKVSNKIREWADHIDKPCPTKWDIEVMMDKTFEQQLCFQIM
ncbi:Hypothetical predicted protein [Mytilus galloprovincialis]|uniref:Uncharacterized protein n=1 Tax=Mytilus galloprovincialis TaxID=29158 RepID=A0A8B6F1C0_MYTGA|nr:Hypothetical predicted protein [Mytilus galloprovincialis]